MSQSKKKESCPICGKDKKNLAQHMKLAHPDEKPDSGAEPIKVKRLRNISWWKLILGAACAVVGVFCIAMYAGSQNMFLGMLAIGGLTPGAFLIYYGLRAKGESGYSFGNEKPVTGKENAIVITATWDSVKQCATPQSIVFKELSKDEIPAGAHPHLLRNNGKHYYEIYNPIDEKTGVSGAIAPVIMPDKKLVTPEAFVIPANMQPYKEYMQFNPPTAFQKIASGVLIIAMIVVGILMTMTTSKAPGEKQIQRTSAMEIRYDNIQQR